MNSIFWRVAGENYSIMELALLGTAYLILFGTKMGQAYLRLYLLTHHPMVLAYRWWYLIPGWLLLIGTGFVLRGCK